MLAKSHKLNSSEFNRVFSQGVQGHTDSFFIKYLSNQTSFRAAVAVSKKHTKSAVSRNHKRRVVYHVLEEVYRTKHSTLDQMYIIVTLKKTALDTGFKTLARELTQFINSVE